ncbi:MAG: hypothetical protein WCL22_06540, partial [bacterium]
MAGTDYSVGSSSLMIINDALRLEGGLVNAPALSFNTKSDTGMYLNAESNLAFSNAGVERLVINAAGVVVSGDLTVNGTTTYLNSTVIQIEDSTIELGKVATPTDLTAEGGGLTLLGATNKTIQWTNNDPLADLWKLSGNVNVEYTLQTNTIVSNGDEPLNMNSMTVSTGGDVSANSLTLVQGLDMTNSDLTVNNVTANAVNASSSNVSGHVSAGSLQVFGLSQLEGPAAMNSSASIAGALTCASSVAANSLSVTNAAVVSGALSASGAFHASSTSALDGAVTCASSVSANSLSVATAAVVAGALSAGGAFHAS